MTPIENAIKEGTSPAIVTGTPQRIGNTLYPNATEASLRKAIDESWRYYQDNYDTYELEEGVNYPSEAWARSQGAKTLPIELPASEIRIHEDIEVPANMQIRGAGNWSGSTLRFYDEACLQLLGDMQQESVLYKPFGGGLDRVQLSGNSGSLVELYGSFQDLRLTNLHVVSKGSLTADIWHSRVATLRGTGFGLVDTRQPHIKELKILNCQFESGNTALYLTAPMRCKIEGNQFLYGELGIAAHEAAEFFIANNTFNGGIKCPAIIEGSNQKGWVTFANNAMDGCEIGAQLYLADEEKQVTDANNFWKGGLNAQAVDYYRKGQSVQKGYGVFKTGNTL